MELLLAVHRKFNLAMITNGFSEVQVIKMKASGITQFFDTVVYSEDLGIKKPHPEIFQLAMKKANCTSDQALMIGDDWDADIIGAMGVQIDQVYIATTENQLNEIRLSDGLKPLRHNREPTFRINNLNELMQILNLNEF
jgi:putative hydrolase of the HAD superfamily